MIQASRQAAARFTQWLLAWGDRRSGPLVLLLLTLVEATIFPAPTEAMLLTLCLSRPRRGLWFAALAAAGSVMGGVIGYHLGAFLYADLARPIVEALGFTRHLPVVESAYRENAWLALVTSGYTPVPYMLYTMAAGAFSLPLEVFVPGSLIGRSLKYVPIVLLAWVFGPAVRSLLSRYAARAGAIITVLLVATIVWRVI